MMIPIGEILPRFFGTEVVNLTCVTLTRLHELFRKTEGYRIRGLLQRGLLHPPCRRPLYYVSLMTSFALQRAAIVPPAFDILLLAYIYIYIIQTGIRAPPRYRAPRSTLKTKILLSLTLTNTVRPSRISRPRSPTKIIRELHYLDHPLDSTDKREKQNQLLVLNIRNSSPRAPQHPSSATRLRCRAQRGRHHRFIHFWRWVRPRRSHDDDVAAENLHDSLHGQFHTVSSTLYHSPPSPRVEETWKTEACSQGGYGRRFGYVRDRFYCSFVARFHSSRVIFHVVSGPSSEALASNSNGIKYIPFGNDSAKFSLSRISSIRNLGRVAEKGMICVLPGRRDSARRGVDRNFLSLLDHDHREIFRDSR